MQNTQTPNLKLSNNIETPIPVKLEADPLTQQF